MGAERPSVFLNAQELARLRTELKTVEWKREIYEKDLGTPRFIGSGIKPNADRWLKQDIVIPARSGHYHNFFCDDGTELRVPDDCKPHAEGYTCPACGKVYKGEKYDAAIRWLIHNRLAVAAFDLGLTYAIENDERYAEKAAEILKKYADAYPGPHTGHTQGGIMYQSLCESVWSIPLAGAYDFIYDSSALSDADKANIEGKLFKPMAQGLVKMGIGGNWGSWHLSAVGVIGYAIRDQELIDYAIKSFKSQIANQLGEDGLWPESVHTYHFYPLGAFLYLAEAAIHNGTDLYHWEAKPGKSLESMFLAPMGYMYPDFRLPAINDGWFNSFMPLSQYELAYARYGDPELAWVVKEGYATRKLHRDGLWAFLQGKTLDGYEKPELQSINFPVLGIAILRSPSGNMMTFDYGPFMGHGQPDKMGITLFANGSLMAADYGTPGYGSASMRWYTSTAAHNTVVVDGKSQARTNERRLTHFGGSPTFEVAEAETEQAYPGVLHKRTVIRVGESFIVIDRLKSEEPHTYDWFF
ncbi:MAG TPA: alginate lyase family protein, partial [Armatimonadota bacterium]|nr:alginate lyase family protein [Armatimonadota bacterium]